MNYVIFCGNFDPIHLGHIEMAKAASEKFNANCIFVPAKISIWKKESISKDHKVNMLSLAIKDYPIFSLDTYEINSASNENYTIDTIKYFLKKYPNDKLYLLIGSDQAEKFDKWKNADELSKLAQVVVYCRPKYNVPKDFIKRFSMLLIKGKPFDCSSSLIREYKTFDINPDVFEYMISNRLYDFNNLFINKYHLNKERLEHVISVAKLAYQIAKANKYPYPIEALIAGLLHDIGKGMSIEEQYDYILRYNINVHGMPKFAYHEFIGEYIAKKDFNISNKRILKAIKNHASGNWMMSKLDKIVYASDKIDPLRGFDSSSLIESMMKNINNGFLMVLIANKQYLDSKSKNTNNKLTNRCYWFYRV